MDNKPKNLNVPYPLGPHLGGPKGAIREAQDPPKRGPKVGWLPLGLMHLCGWVSVVLSAVWCAAVGSVVFFCGVVLCLVVLFGLVSFVLCWLVWGAEGRRKGL